MSWDFTRHYLTGKLVIYHERNSIVYHLDEPQHLVKIIDVMNLNEELIERLKNMTLHQIHACRDLAIRQDKEYVEPLDITLAREVLAKAGNKI